MRAVSNTSPISKLASIGRLSLLPSQSSEVWIPPAVLEELFAHPEAKTLATIQTALKDNWIRSTPPSSSHLLSILSSQLHRGEAEAIAFAADSKADVVIIDEQEGRQLATRANLYVTGVLGVLLRAEP